jgi:hypothetical protein
MWQYYGTETGKSRNTRGRGRGRGILHEKNSLFIVPTALAFLVLALKAIHSSQCSGI